MRVAAVDVGTNSVRLLVADPGAPLAAVDRRTQITRLGRGVDATGRLDDAALARTLQCIAGYARRWSELGAERVRITATSAIRDATDRERFFDAVAQRTGTPAEVLSGEEEARTAYRGAVASVGGRPPYLVLDIGGGSTELILGDGQPVTMTSRQLGCVRLTERALRGDPPSAAEVTDAARLVDAELDAAAGEVDAASAATLVGVAGTVTTVAALHLDLPRYDPEAIHGTVVPLAGVASLCDALLAMPVAAKAALGPMAPGREDVIAAGCLILRRVMERFGFGEVLVSEADILDGLALSLLDR